MTQPNTKTILADLYQVLQQRKKSDPKSSYVAELYAKGRGAILRKVDEEAFNVVMAAKDETRGEVIEETADLLFHLWVMLADMDLSPEDVLQELVERFGRSGLEKPPPPRRTSERRGHRKELVLNMKNGMTLTGYTSDVSLEGLLVETDFEPKWQLVGEQGSFEIQMVEQTGSDDVRIEVGADQLDSRLTRRQGGHVQDYRINFEVARATDDGLGLRILDNQGLFGFALSEEVFRDIL